MMNDDLRKKKKLIENLGKLKKDFTKDDLINWLLSDVGADETYKDDFEEIFYREKYTEHLSLTFSEFWHNFLIRLNARRQEDKDRIIREKQEACSKKLLQTIVSGDPPEKVFADAKTIINHFELISEPPKPPLINQLKEQWKVVDSARGETFLGFKLDRFEKLTEKFDGIQTGLYLIAADTNVGKTAVLTNIFLSALLTNPKLSGVFLTLDDPVHTIAHRLLTLLTKRLILQDSENKKISKDQKTRILNSCTMNKLRKYLNENIREYVYKARQELEKLLKRVEIKGLSDIENIEDAKAFLKKQKITNKNIIVCIDALYNLIIGSESGTREKNIERANLLKDISTSLDIPIFSTAELRKKAPKTLPRDKNAPPDYDDIMETGKYSYNADIIIMLYPENYENFKTFEKKEPTVILDVQKNKLSPFTGKIFCKFYKLSTLIEEIEIEVIGTEKGNLNNEKENQTKNTRKDPTKGQRPRLCTRE